MKPDNDGFVDRIIYKYTVGLNLYTDWMEQSLLLVNLFYLREEKGE